VKRVIYGPKSFTQRAYHHAALSYPRGGAIVDVGANVEVISRFALQQTGGCRLIANEPAVGLFAYLKQNLTVAVDRVD
jgi:hypothetical protein